MVNVLELKACYRLIAELLLNPNERDSDRIKKELQTVRDCSAGICESLDRFMAEPSAFSPDEYIKTLELAPICPLYLGSYLYNEPTSCRGVGMSGRNGYMIELTNVYKHFGYEMQGSELPDYLPLMVDFLWISLEHQERDRIGLRRRFLEHYVLPGIEPLLAALKKHESPYQWLIKSLVEALQEDAACMVDQPMWEPPIEDVKKQNQELSCRTCSQQKEEQNND